MTTTTSKRQPPAPNVPLAIWPVGQIPAHEPAIGRYLAECAEHPATMLPALARRIIEEYSKPGDLVVDPMCGIGTTLVEAAALGRRAIGIETERPVGRASPRRTSATFCPRTSVTLSGSGPATPGRSRSCSLTSRAASIWSAPRRPVPVGAGNLDNRQRSQGGSPRPTRAGNHSPSRANLGDVRGDASAGGDGGRSTPPASRCSVPAGCSSWSPRIRRRQGAMFDLAGTHRVPRPGRSASPISSTSSPSMPPSGDGSLVARPSFGQRTAIRKAGDRGRARPPRRPRRRVRPAEAHRSRRPPMAD